MSPNNPLQRYKIRRKIGTGGMASVFLATDTLLNREVALKMVHPHLLHHPETLRRFSNEAQAIAALSHENIIRIFDFGESRSRPFIVMEYIDGVTLEALINREGTIPNIVTVSIARQVLSALVCAHARGIYHRDIKPGNILIDRNGCVRITDFGIAYLVNAESVTLTGSFLGSPHYISPEQVSNRPVRGNTDIFSLGVVLYQCLTGFTPFNADTPHGVINEILSVDPPSPPVKNARVLLWFTDLVESCLIKDAGSRPGSSSILGRLESACSNESISAGNDRITAFIGNPASCRRNEETEITTIYRGKAYEALGRKQRAAALKSFEQAERFGTLDAADRKVIDRIARQSAAVRMLSRGVLIGAGTAVLLPAGMTLYRAITVRLHPSGQQTVSQQNEPTGSQKSRPAEGTDGVPTRTKDVGIPNTVSHPVNNRQPAHPAAGPPTAAPAAPSTNHRPVPAPASPDTLQRLSGPGFFRCLTNPPWVTVYIDAIERGKTPTLPVVPLSPGRHIVHLVKRSYTEFTDTVLVAPSETTLVRIRLQPERSESTAP